MDAGWYLRTGWKIKFGWAWNLGILGKSFFGIFEISKHYGTPQNMSALFSAKFFCPQNMIDKSAALVGETGQNRVSGLRMSAPPFLKRTY